eukprot:Amastigsp_a508454_261.p2 type:complete len:272 gc:universal Amastigsp_a508454_261:57-872(+)
MARRGAFHGRRGYGGGHVAYRGSLTAENVKFSNGLALWSVCVSTAILALLIAALSLPWYSQTYAGYNTAVYLTSRVSSSYVATRALPSPGPRPPSPPPPPVGERVIVRSGSLSFLSMPFTVDLLNTAYGFAVCVLILALLNWLIVCYVIGTTYASRDLCLCRAALPLRVFSNIVLVLRMAFYFSTMMSFGVGLPAALKQDCTRGATLMNSGTDCSSWVYMQLAPSSFLSSTLKGSVEPGFIVFAVSMGISFLFDTWTSNMLLGCGKAGRIV